MCGIAGIFSYHYASHDVDREELRRIRDYMIKRGPDGYGEWYSKDGHTGLAHRRLSIIDLSERGAQPMLSSDGNYVVTFNGEIYNYRALRTQLEAKGCIFRSNSDTEVLLHLYADRGAAMVNDLRGMFAFGLWDAKQQSLLLARDPYGIKPLYYADDGWTLRFASQVKALLAGEKISREPEAAGWVGYYLFGHVPEPYTTFQQIRALPAGCYMWVNQLGPHEPRRYFSIAQVFAESEKNPVNTNDDDTQQYVREALLDSVRHHLVADVPIGAFLSAGVDSGALVALMREESRTEIQTVTLAFDEFRGTSDDEAPSARKFASEFGVKHTTRYVTQKEFLEDLPHILEVMDQPTIDGLNTWFVSKAAHELGLKVAVSGLGGDELFGGYPSFQDMPRWVRFLAVPASVPYLGAAIRVAGQTLLGHTRINSKAFSLLEHGGTYSGAYLLRRGVYPPSDLETILDREIVKEGLRRLRPMELIGSMLQPAPQTGFGIVATLESSLYMRNQLLRDTDWASMAHSLEVRVPLVDATLLQQISRVTVRAGTRNQKSLLANAPTRSELLRVSLARPKTGFSTPIARWLERDSTVNNWERIPSLARRGCAWAKRWAFAVGGPNKNT